MNGTCIHKANLIKKTDFKTDSVSRLFTDVLFGVFGRLPDFYKNQSFYNKTRETFRGAGGENVENVNYQTRIKIALMFNVNYCMSRQSPIVNYLCVEEVFECLCRCIIVTKNKKLFT